ncbi:unnamed protein product, partial [Prorocentrum cordatum]
DFDVDPSDTIKSVKQRVISQRPPPDWANSAVLFRVSAEDGAKASAHLSNKARLQDCEVVEGSRLRFAYARSISAAEKLEYHAQGLITAEEFRVPACTMEA